MECDATIEGTPFDVLTYPEGYNKNMGCFDHHGGMCCQIVCKGGYRCQNKATHILDISNLVSKPTYCSRAIYQPPSYTRNSNMLQICSVHWDAIKTRKQSSVEWITWGTRGACIVLASTAALLAATPLVGLAAAPVAGTAAARIVDAIGNVVQDVSKSAGAAYAEKKFGGRSRQSRILNAELQHMRKHATDYRPMGSLSASERRELGVPSLTTYLQRFPKSEWAKRRKIYRALPLDFGGSNPALSEPKCMLADRDKWMAMRPKIRKQTSKGQ